MAEKSDGEEKRSIEMLWQSKVRSRRGKARKAPPRSGGARKGHDEQWH
jgi:hypothetical protein